MTHRDTWYADIRLMLGAVVARAVVMEDEPSRYQVHILSPDWMPPMELADSREAAKRRAAELAGEKWPNARFAEWQPEPRSVTALR